MPYFLTVHQDCWTCVGELHINCILNAMGFANIIITHCIAITLVLVIAIECNEDVAHSRSKRFMPFLQGSGNGVSISNYMSV